jgi:hypothetical protein
VVNSLGDRSAEILPEQRHVVPVIDRPRLEGELFAEKIEQLSEGVHGGRNETPLDPGDRCLGGPSAVGQLLLRQPVPATGFTKELSSRHVRSISDLM